MHIKEFMLRFGIKKEAQVLSWIEKGYIKGATQDAESGEYHIPELARPPYTSARAKNTEAIYRSIVRACVERKAVCAELYKISTLEFQKYIDDLAAAEIISVVEEQGVIYYYATLKSSEFLSSKNPLKFIHSCLTSVAAGVSKGMTSAILEKAIV